jgi:MFS family permease
MAEVDGRTADRDATQLVSVASTGSRTNRWAVLALLGVAQLIVVLYATIVTIATPSAQEALHFSMESRQWIVTAYALAFGGGAGLLTRLVAASTPASRARRADR